jgi:hypothetical protein
MVEGRARCELEALGDLPYGGRRPVLLGEAAHEAEYLALPLRHVFQCCPLDRVPECLCLEPGCLLNTILVNTR